ncbi:efflux RND transporter periplasmic adaptor subunit [Aliishimia ponticola]|nr:efflux RND transporter periplasmic adaptor subunit [Aliishimia ponticola]
MNLKPLLIVPPLVLGIGGFILMNRADPPELASREDSALAVRVMTVTAGPLDVTATGYGRVEAVRNWTSVAQVSGRITDSIDDLSEGTLVEAGTEIMTIDATDYELAIQKSQANIAAAEADLAELRGKEDNSRRLLELEQSILTVAKAEYERVQGLVERGSSSASSLDAAQKTLLAQENALTTVSNSLALYPAQLASAQATLEVRQAELAEAQRGLENTRIVAPFRGRISNAPVEVGQYVSVGETLVAVNGVDTAEIVASFQPSDFGSVAQVAVGQTLRDMTTVDSTGIVGYLSDAGVTATVNLELADFDAVWDAELVRFRGTIDTETGTVGLAVRVSDPLSANNKERRPPLNIGSFVSVSLHVQAPGDTIAIPRSALHYGDDGQVFVFTADAEDKLAIVPIKTGPVTGANVLVREGLSDGDRLVLSDPRPPVPGMPLTLVTENEER